MGRNLEQRTLRFLLAACILACGGIVAGCEKITGHPRCDESVAAPLVEILQWGWSVNCKPNFSSTDQFGVRHHAWTDPARETVFVWPDQMSDRLLLKVLWHEAGHVTYIERNVHYPNVEWWADAFAYCHMSSAQRSGIGFLLPKPTPTQCYLFTV